MLGVDIGIGVAIQAWLRDARTLRGSIAIVTGIQARGGIRVAPGDLTEIQAGCAEVVMTGTTATKIVRGCVIAAAVASSTEISIREIAATLDHNINCAAGEGTRNFGECQRGFYAADRDFGIGGWY